jgi:uncharacterized protein (DUF362 family)
LVDVKRRDFIKKSTVGAFAIPFIPHLASVNINTVSKTIQQTNYDLVAIRGGGPAEMFARAIQDLGGIEKFVSKNQSVVVKPNMGWDVPPERAANANPKLIGEIVKQCKSAGAKDVYVFDHTCDEWTRAYKTSGIQKEVEDAGGTMVPGNFERNYQDVTINFGRRLTDTKVHELILESDVFINVPVLKHHGSTQVSLGMKNNMGIVWDRGYWHRNDLHQCIADFASFKKPDLTVIDCYNALKRNGPRGVSEADVVNMKAQIISSDIVAADAAAAKMLGREPTDIGHIKIAGDSNLGEYDLTKLSISRLKM